MKPFRALISLEEAIDIMEKNLVPISRTEDIGLDDACGRVLAESIVANIDVPPFDRSAMDGYAVRAEDTYEASQSAPIRLKVVEILQAEESSSKSVAKGGCIQLSTGCKIPDGADSVLMYENTEKEGEEILIYKPVHPGENVSKRGSDLRMGETVLREGEPLNPARIGVLSALGISHVRVYDKPSVAVIPTGSELTEVGSPLSGTKVYDINTHTLVSIVKDSGGIPVRFDIVPDERDEMKRALGKALASDLVILTGGSSVGERDLIYSVLADEGQILFHGIQVKPGKPTLGALVGKRIVLGMPGHPTSCLSNAYLFLIPILRKLARLPERKMPRLKAKLARRVVSTLGRRVFLTVKLVDQEAMPVFKESSAITSMAEADGYIVIPENVDTLEKGDLVDIYLFS